MKIPTNYRKHYFHLFEKDISIAGLAGPHNNPDVDEVFKFLYEVEKRKVLIGLHEAENFGAEAKENGIEYYYKPMRDLSALRAGPEEYEEIYNIIKRATAEDKKVSIHCGSGDGRTGTVLAALKLRELLETAAKQDPSVFSKKLDYSYQVESTFDGLISCTPFVKAAVEALRKQRNPESGLSGSKSVETKHDIIALMDYEEYLRKIIKKELGENLEEQTTFSLSQWRKGI